MDKVIHGDIVLERVPAMPQGAQAKPRAGRLVVAEGEVTGHAHAIASPAATEYAALDGTRYIAVEPSAEPAVLDHEEHGPRVLEPGVYRVREQQEYDLLGEARRVAD